MTIILAILAIIGAGFFLVASFLLWEGLMENTAETFLRHTKGKKSN